MITYENDLRVWLNRNGDNEFIYVDTKNEAKKIIRAAIAKDLTDESITMNAFGLEIYEDFGEGLQWSEWYSEETGDDIMSEIDEEDNNLDEDFQTQAKDALLEIGLPEDEADNQVEDYLSNH